MRRVFWPGSRRAEGAYRDEICDRDATKSRGKRPQPWVRNFRGAVLSCVEPGNREQYAPDHEPCAGHPRRPLAPRAVRPRAPAPGEVVLLHAEVAEDPADLAPLRALLSPEETARAERYHFEADRARSITARGVARWALASMLGRAPASLSFQPGAHGKPALRAAPQDLRFNYAHSGQAVLLAFARAREVGVDVEPLRAMPEAERIVARYFSPREVEAFREAPPPDRDRAFLNGWTRKEAFIKALGLGLLRNLGSFDVALKPGEEPRLLATRDDPDEARRWSLAAFEPAPGYLGAAVVEGPPCAFRTCRLPRGAFRARGIG
ncbi:MAG: 4'-phosphopantetheinyl transferase superfamily protein [Planctomycetota bacterium]|nr:4'-phosphopantetheinyl transferase superfamily protein [Planctomycetota bacterium]